MKLVNRFPCLAGLATPLLSVSPANATLDVVFLMDDSGSIGAPGWAADQHFIQGIINNDLPLGASQIGLITFSSTVTTRSQLVSGFPEFEPLTSGSKSGIDALVASLPYTGGLTHTLDGVTAALALFNSDTDLSDQKVLITVTDGNPNPTPSQNPCSSEPAALTDQAGLAANNVTGLMIGVGPDINPNTLACLYNNTSSHYIPVGAWTSTDLTDALPAVNQQISTVPEPASVAMLVLGGAATIWQRRLHVAASHR